jgi:signal transduction histidine kinase
MVPIIMVTALSDKEDIARCLQAGATDFVSKPVNGLELRARVHAMLRIKQQYDSIQALSKLQRNTIHLLEGSLQTLRGNLASSLSHELNTPLNGILGGLGLLNAHWEDMEGEEMAELLELSHQSAQRLERLIQKFLVYLRLELATPPAQPPTVPLAHTIMTQATEQCAIEARRSDDIEVSIHTASLAIESQDLQRLLIELVDNALKFSSPGTPVQVVGRRQERCYRLSVCDRGRGMTQSQVASVGAFMQFERSSYEQQGMGLGLKIAQKITELYGGHLLIDSTYKTGTTVHVDLPFAKVEDALTASHSGEMEA